MSRIPIKDLKLLADKNGQDMLVVFGTDKDGQTTHVATWGRNIELCDRAATFGNNMKVKLGWPESLTHAEPSRVRRLQARIKELEKQLPDGAKLLDEHEEYLRLKGRFAVLEQECRQIIAIAPESTPSFPDDIVDRQIFGSERSEFVIAQRLKLVLESFADEPASPPKEKMI